MMLGGVSHQQSHVIKSNFPSFPPGKYFSFKFLMNGKLLNALVAPDFCFSLLSTKLINPYVKFSNFGISFVSPSGQLISSGKRVSFSILVKNTKRKLYTVDTVAWLFKMDQDLILGYDFFQGNINRIHMSSDNFSLLIDKSRSQSKSTHGTISIPLQSLTPSTIPNHSTNQSPTNTL